MRIRTTLLVCTVVALPQLALAQLNSSGLGTAHEIYAFCAQLDPADATTFDQQWKSVLGNASSQEVSAAESSAGYQQAADSTKALLGRIPPSVLAEGCAGGAAQWRQSPASSNGAGRKDGEHDRDDPRHTKRD